LLLLGTGLAGTGLLLLRRRRTASLRLAEARLPAAAQLD
jgi:hypothetical protein